jgi:adenylyl-sulfate kinase
VFIEITPRLSRRKHLEALDYKFVISHRYRRVTSVLTFRKKLDLVCKAGDTRCEFRASWSSASGAVGNLKGVANLSVSTTETTFGEKYPTFHHIFLSIWPSLRMHISDYLGNREAESVDGRWLAIDKVARAGQKFQKPVCVWLTGLSGSGKSTIANLVEKRLFAAGRHTYVLDGDNIRLGLNRDLGFSEPDRRENIRRVTEVARLLVDAGLIVIVAFISPYREGREAARSRFESGEFVEIFIDAPIEECERRDPKGLYARARRGEIVNFTGIDSKYEPPECPDARLDTVAFNAEECADEVLRLLDIAL